MILSRTILRLALASAALFLVSLPVLAQVRVQATVTAGQGNIRLILNHDAQVDYRVRTSQGRVEIVYSRSIELLPEQRKVDDPILKRFELQGDRTVVLRTGNGYRSYETFELSNPFRLVVDLQGVRDVESKPDRKGDRETARQKIVVIDPGHGGSEKGAEGPTGLLEKEVTLDLARRLRRELQDDKGIAVVLTRDEDRRVDLDERTAISNHNQAELFVSIHLNGSPRQSAAGAETYFLSADATDDEARTAAALENRSYQPTDNDNAVEKDDKTGLELVLWDLAQNQYLAESSLLAESVQRHLNELTGTRDRGVKQAPFRVLMGATSPAILVEVGFISNPEEELRFKGLSYRNQVVEALAEAVRDYLETIERLSVPGAYSGPGSGDE